MYLTIIIVSILLGSCNVQERIVFNDDMGGRFESIIDLSAMMTITSQNKPADSEKEVQEKIDTLIVFNDILEMYKDSIASLPEVERQKMENLKDFTMGMKVDIESGEMAITIGKEFGQFSDLERVSYDMDKAFDNAKSTVPGGSEQASGPAGSMLTMDKVIYTFTDNTFRRTDPKVLTEHLGDDTVLSDKTKEEIKTLEESDEAIEGVDDMFAGMITQMGEELEHAKMSLEYVFPRKVISVSPEGAVISDDGKTVTFEVDWKTLLDEEKSVLENFEVVLEDK